MLSLETYSNSYIQIVIGYFIGHLIFNVFLQFFLYIRGKNEILKKQIAGGQVEIRNQNFKIYKNEIFYSSRLTFSGKMPFALFT